jgi:RNA polymerase sigma-70 factor (ECF subfamily)
VRCHISVARYVPWSDDVKDPPDKDLLGRLQSLDPMVFEDAFQSAYAAHKSVVHGFLRRLSGDADAAADLFQNVWLKLARHRHRLTPDTDLRAWLCTVARREYLSYRRAQTVDLGRLLTFGREPLPEASPADARLLELDAALRRLSDADREALLLTSVEGLSMTQAAAVLELAEPALRQRVARARRRLTAAVQKAGAAGERRTWFRAAKKGET